jgi:hypothetical protein
MPAKCVSDVGAVAADHGEGGRAHRRHAGRDLVGQSGDLVEQFAQLARFGAVVERSDQFDRLRMLTR